MPTILIVPDIHGKTEVLAKAQPYFHQADYVIQLGDIVDSEDANCPNNILWQVFLDWHQLKKEQPHKFILLWGNHEFSYLNPQRFIVPKHRSTLEEPIKEYLLTHQDLDIAWQCQLVERTWLFTHAGVCQSFCQDYQLNQNNLASSLQKLFTNNPTAFWQDNSPLWIRDQLFTDPIANYQQIVGHTPLTQVQEEIVNDCRLIRADTWHYLRGTTQPMGTQNLLLLSEKNLQII